MSRIRFLRFSVILLAVMLIAIVIINMRVKNVMNVINNPGKEWESFISAWANTPLSKLENKWLPVQEAWAERGLKMSFEQFQSFVNKKFGNGNITINSFFYQSLISSLCKPGLPSFLIVSFGVLFFVVGATFLLFIL